MLQIVFEKTVITKIILSNFISTYNKDLRDSDEGMVRPGPMEVQVHKEGRESHRRDIQMRMCHSLNALGVLEDH